MEQDSDRQFVRNTVISAASFGLSAGVFFMLGFNDVLRDRTVGWLELGSVFVFASCFIVVYRRALRRFPQ